MKQSKISHYLKYVAAILFFVGILIIGLYGSSVKADHVNQYKGKGYAYGAISDDGDNSADTGIGYLSFGCEGDVSGVCDSTATDNFHTGYGVRINTNPNSQDQGKFFGYAWSSNYGWVSFYHNDVAVCGPERGLEILGDVQNAIHTPGWNQVLDGYARVLNYDADEWNGCIKFSGEAKDGSKYFSQIETVNEGQMKLSGWAWGSNVIGWVSFDCKECNVTFEPNEDEKCDETNDPEVCGPPPETGGLGLYVGPQNATVDQILGNTMYSASTTNFSQPISIKLIPQSFLTDVYSCTAVASGNQGANISGWSGSLSALNPLSPGNLSNHFPVTISNYVIGEIVTFTINCMTVVGDVPISAQAFVTINYPQAGVSITANPNPIDTVLDPGGATNLAWSFNNVQDNSCVISGVVDFSPTDGSAGLTTMTNAFAQSIGFVGGSSGNSPLAWTAQTPGTDGLNGIVNFPVGFTITCQNYAGLPVTDSVYITTTTLGCTPNMEAAGWCSNDINPIFEEF